MSIIHWIGTTNLEGGVVPSLVNLDAVISLESLRNTIFGGTATADVGFESDGEATLIQNQTPGTDSLTPAQDYNTTDWWTAKPDVGIGASYEVRATLILPILDGNLTFFTGVLDTWIDLNTSPRWRLTDSGTNVTQAFAERRFTIEIRNAGGPGVLATSTVELGTNLFDPSTPP